MKLKLKLPQVAALKGWKLIANMRAHSVMSNSLWSTECNLPSSSVHEILQARVLGCHFLLSSSFWLRNRTCIPCIASRFFSCWAIREAQKGVIIPYNPPWRNCQQTNPPPEDTPASCPLKGKNHQPHRSYSPSPSDGTGYLFSSGKLETRQNESLHSYGERLSLSIIFDSANFQNIFQFICLHSINSNFQKEYLSGVICKREKTKIATVLSFSED